MYEFDVLAAAAFFLMFGFHVRGRIDRFRKASLPSVMTDPETREPRTEERFLVLLVQAGFSCGRLVRETQKGCFEDGYQLQLRYRRIRELTPEWDGSKLAYQLPQKTCWKCQGVSMYRLSQCVQGHPGEVCIVCWRCGWLHADVYPLPNNDLAGRVPQGADIGLLLGRLTAQVILDEAQLEIPLARADLDRLRSLQRLLADLEARLTADMEHLLEIQADAPERSGALRQDEALAPLDSHRV